MEQRAVYLPKREIARLQELQSIAPIAIKEGGPSTTHRGGDLKTIVLSDEALASFTKNPKGDWETLTLPLAADPNAPKALKGVQFSIASSTTRPAKRQFFFAPRAGAGVPTRSPVCVETLYRSL